MFWVNARTAQYNSHKLYLKNRVHTRPLSLWNSVLFDDIFSISGKSTRVSINILCEIFTCTFRWFTSTNFSILFINRFWYSDCVLWCAWQNHNQFQLCIDSIYHETDVEFSVWLVCRWKQSILVNFGSHIKSNTKKALIRWIISIVYE